MARTMPLCALLLLALLASPWAPRAAAEDAPQIPTEEDTARAIRSLESPFERARRGGVRALVDGLPGTREAVVAALPDASSAVQLLLVEVLAHDASLPAIRALLATMNRASESLAVRIRLLLVQDEEPARRVLEAWEAEPNLRQDETGAVTQRTEDLERLLRRAEAERLFVSRKSKTGSTGSYRGQYDVLLPYRREALEVCVGILTDRAIPIPGVYTAGTFSFLRPPPVHVRTNELIGMAAHAFSELGRPTDTRHLMALTRRLLELDAELRRVRYYQDRVRFGDLANQYADLLVALYLVHPASLRARMEEFLTDLEKRYNNDLRFVLGATYHPIVLLRIGRYEEAVQELEELVWGGDAPSRASAHYNLACAYAQWGEQLEGPMRAFRLEQALDHLEISVDHQWLDIGWMEQDRDLEPIRDTDRYRKLAARVHAALNLDGD